MDKGICFQHIVENIFYARKKMHPIPCENTGLGSEIKAGQEIKENFEEPLQQFGRLEIQ